MKPVRLFLHEEILLLALRDKKGTIATSGFYVHAVGGALMAELLLAGRIKVEDAGSKQFAKLVSSKSMKNDVLDECIAKLSAAKRRATLQTWISRFANISQLKNRVAQGLCDQNVLKADEDKILWIFTRKIYPEVNPKPEKEIIERLRKAIFTNSREVEPRTSLLATLANSTNVLDVVFDKKKLKERKVRLEQLANNELIGKATKQVVEAAQAAVMVAIMVPTIMS